MCFFPDVFLNQALVISDESNSGQKTQPFSRITFRICVTGWQPEKPTSESVLRFLAYLDENYKQKKSSNGSWGMTSEQWRFSPVFFVVQMWF